jgi:DNA-binding NtrC family response regulator
MPVPDAIAPVQEQLCIIVTEDEYLLKHVRRMVRNANFLVSSFSSGIEAGFEIAITKPSLIVLDADLATADPKQISEHIQKLLDYHPHFMVFSSDTSMCLDKQDRAKMTTLSKPLSLNDFAQALDEALLGWA